MTKLISLLVLFVICVLGVAIALVNTVPVSFNYYFNQIESPLSLLLVFTFIAGVFSTLILIIPTLIKLKFFSKQKNNPSSQHNFQHAPEHSSESLPLISPNKHS